MVKAQMHVLSDTFNWADAFSVKEDILEKAVKLADEEDENDDDCFISMLINEIYTDGDRKTVKLFEDYKNASRVERRAIDGIFVDISGWSLSTLIRRYIESHKTEQKEETGGSSAVDKI